MLKMNKPIPYAVSNTLHIPKGFGVLLEKLAMEILRSQPLDIVSFSANYFDQLLEERNETNEDITQCDKDFEQRTYDDEYFDTNQSIKQAKEKETAVIKIQSIYRGFKTRQQTEELRSTQDMAARTIQHRFRNHMHQQTSKKQATRKPVNADEAASRIQAHYKGYKTRQSNAKIKMEVSATKIQATFRGYSIRKLQTKEISTVNMNLEKSATTIQSTYRGYKVRKSMKQKKETQMQE